MSQSQPFALAPKLIKERLLPRKAQDSVTGAYEGAKLPTVVPATITDNSTGSAAPMRSLTTATSKEKPVSSIATGRASGATAAKKAQQ